MILIAGGGGFVGQNIARCFVERGERVLLVQRHAIEPSPLLAPYWKDQIEQAAGSIQDLPFVLGLIKEHSVKSIVHSAMAAADPRASAVEGLHEKIGIHVGGTINLLEAARLMDLRRVTYISSVLAYIGVPADCEVLREDTPLPSDTATLMTNFKKATEQISLLYARNYGFSFVSLRVGWVYGPESRSGRNPITRMVTDAAAGKPVRLPAVDPNFRADTVYAKDVGEATRMVHLAESLDHPIYNLGDGGFPSMKEAAEFVREVIPGAQIELGPAGQNKPPFRIVSMERLKAEFGFEPLGLKDGIRAFAEYLQNGVY